MTDTTELQYLKLLIENQFQLINERLNNNDKNISKILRKLSMRKKEKAFQGIEVGKEIDVVSYLDD